MKTRIIIILLAFSLIQACTSTNKKNTSPQAPSPKALTKLTPEQLIQKAQITSNQFERSYLYLEAAEQLCEANLLSQCYSAINDINKDHLNPALLSRLLPLSIHLGIEYGDQNRIIDIYETYPQSILDTLPLETQINFYRALHSSYAQQDQPLNAAIIIFDNSGLFDPTKQKELLDLAWHSLRTGDPIELAKYIYTGDNADTLAWLDLARTIQLNQSSMDEQYSAYQAWKNLWPTHPATISPPKELEILDRLPTSKPEKITLALPLTGPIAEAGLAIRDGFMAAHFDATSRNPQPESRSLNIEFFDTHTDDISKLYNTQKENGYIVGPLDKNSISKLNKLDNINTATLVLNHFDENNKRENLYQFSLAPESEAQQITKHLNSLKLTKAAILLPESNLGFRMQDAFNEAFSNENSLLIESAFYGDQKTFADTVASLLNTKSSKNRKHKIQAITGERFEFIPRKRNDVDAIIMVAKPEAAKQLKPLISYNYASDLPVFASSHIHSANKHQVSRDLNGIQFIDMPWMLSDTINTKRAINKAKTNDKNNYSRFHALGADAYQLLPRLEILKQVRDSQLQGQTGSLKMDEHGIISRDMQWAVFRKGKPITL